MATFVPDLTGYAIYEDGTESGANIIGAEDTPQSLEVGSDYNLGLRVQISETGSKSGDSTDDWKLQVSYKGGAYNDVTGVSSYVKTFNSANLAEEDPTTERLTAGAGDFVTGEVSEDGEVTDFGLNKNDYTELLYSVTLISADLSAGDYVEFRVLINGATFTYSLTPRINVSPDVTVSPAVQTIAVSLPQESIELGVTQSPSTQSLTVAKAGVLTLTNDLKYMMEDEVTLSTDDGDLATQLNLTQMNQTKTDDADRVALADAVGFAVFLFKEKHTNNTDEIDISWNGQFSTSTVDSTAYLQIYNYNTPGWETLNSESTEVANTDFTLTGSKTTNLSNYYTTGNWIAYRVYQEAV